MSTEKKEPVEKKSYSTPEIKVHGDVEDITRGNAIGEDLDAGFTSDAVSGGRSGRKKPKAKRFS